MLQGKVTCFCVVPAINSIDIVERLVSNSFGSEHVNEEEKR